MRRLLKPCVHAVVVGLVLALSLVWSGPAQARTAPKTLADPRPVQAGIVRTDFRIQYLGVLWDTAPGQGHAGEGTGPAPHGEVRLRVDGTWTAWRALQEDGAQGRDQWTSALVSAAGADAYQVRNLPPQAKNPRAVPLNTTDGPDVVVDRAPGGAARAIDSDRCRSRADWGADETLRLDTAGNDVWEPDFHPAQVTTVHHTATANDDPDPEATLRAIYRYHAVDNGWGDIGYQYLIDESGTVYEGRWSGTTSASCETGNGTGADFAHEHGTDRMVTGAHTGGWNSGNLGVALLGEFTTNRRFGAEPKAAAVSSLETLLAELAARHGFDPTQLDHDYVNPVNGEKRVVPTVAGHRDYQATECPGERLHAMLPTIRQNVAALSGSSPGDGGTSAPDGGGTMHVGDLDGAAAASTRNQWTATVTATAHDGGGQPVAGATVEGTWTTTGATAGCSTGADGTCAVESPRLAKSTDRATFRVDALGKESWTYDRAANGDPEADSDGTTITVARPG